MTLIRILTSLAIAAVAGTAGAQMPGHHHDFAPPVAAFHDLMAPLWHAPPGSERMQRTCAVIAEFRARAAAIASPSADGLRDAVASLGESCDADPAAFNAAFAGVHRAFHGVEAMR